VKGFRNSPYGERRIGAVTAIKARAPVLGGNFGVWGGLFSTFDCAVKGIRKKEDPYNASKSCHLSRRRQVDPTQRVRVRIKGEFTGDKASTRCYALRWLLTMFLWLIVIAGFFTGGALAVRGGMKAARNSAIGCACLLAVFEGVGIGIQRLMAENTRLEVS
jgi:mitochondrial import inner membrane translocase subunit TIM17